MNSNNTTRGGALVLAWFVLCGAACAAGPTAPMQSSATAAGALGDSGARRSLLTNGAADEPQATVNGNVAELQQMIREGKVKELRTTYNGSYGASMLFYPDEMTFYIALFQQKKFWRVIKTQVDSRAETLYADFAKNTAALADTEIRRTKLEAEKSFADRLIAVQQGRANRLQADLDVARAQQSQVADRQAEQQEAIRSLRAEQDAAQAQLRALQTKVQDLQRQSDVDLMPLPK
ncbi:hypothetical protein EOS_06320 [Caballeronia mineralivorans PML1(12)]|jgi:hypothetical protein|uniref:Uncharacterized protein n=1 Tax=Caballeronia mineralivorans PML1(12) TaxID=908627 RepID=A0A0J1G456_9BURK|nr:DUF2968 domain-containing protein [Caballeronia mineralivorans]KLU26973.1 hypothetical protein EOS_06320 [Caballeronia mineralivorans PML1(12)]